jgi:polyphosphate kinase
MQRNLRRRVEIAFPVLDPKAKKRVIEEGLLVHSNKNPSAWEMDADGNYNLADKPEALDGSALIRGSQSESQNQLLKRLSGFDEF